VPLQPARSPHLESVRAYGGHSERGHCDAHGDRQNRHTTTKLGFRDRSSGSSGPGSRPHGLCSRIAAHHHVERRHRLFDAHAHAHSIRCTAAENKPFFDYLNNQAIAAAGGQPDGPAFINSLRAGGFAVETMELTPDITTVGVKADSVQFSVHAADACLIGQWGAVGGYTSIIAAPLSTGKCFIGQTRAIDF
jgi:hypothetical protein